MTAAATARAIVHRVAAAQTFDDLVRIGDSLGVSRELPPAVYVRRLRRRLWEMRLLAESRPYRATGVISRFN